MFCSLAAQDSRQLSLTLNSCKALRVIMHVLCASCTMGRAPLRVGPSTVPADERGPNHANQCAPRPARLGGQCLPLTAPQADDTELMLPMLLLLTATSMCPPAIQASSYHPDRPKPFRVFIWPARRRPVLTNMFIEQLVQTKRPSVQNPQGQPRMYPPRSFVPPSLLEQPQDTMMARRCRRRLDTHRTCCDLT